MTIRLFIYLFVVHLYLLFCAGAVQAQNVKDYVKAEAPHSWVRVSEPDFDWETDIPERDTFYNLVDWQAQYTKDNSKFYNRYVQKLLTSTGVEDQSAITVNLDPNYQRIIFHSVDVRRGRQVFDRLDLDDFQIYRSETDRQKLIYNGELQLAYNIPDVRPGDIVDYSYTIEGRNPALGAHVYYSAGQDYNDVVHKIHYRLSVDKSLNTILSTVNDPKPPVISTEGSLDVYEWHLDNSKPVVSDDDRPNWHQVRPYYILRSFENWAEIGQFFSKYYAIPKDISESLSREISKIKTQANTPAERLDMATNFVQREIRYLGVELGESGYVPRSPNKVMERRFGDCKDMTLLLLTMLDALDIDANALLVNMDSRGGIDKAPPSAGRFDHVVVRANIAGKYYVIDPTMGEQIGSLEVRQQGYFEKGLVVSQDSPGIVDVPINMPEFFEDHSLSFDLVSDPKTITFKQESKYYMSRADSMLGWFRDKGHEEAQKAFFDYYLKEFASLEVSKTLSVDINEDRGEVSFSIDFKIPNAWTPNLDTPGDLNFTVYAYDTDSDVPDFVAGSRTSPYSFTHPKRTREVQTYKVADGWEFDDEEILVEKDAFKFEKKSVFKDNVYTQTYTYLSKQDFIAADQFEDTMKSLAEIDDELGIVLRKGDGKEGDLTREDWLIVLGLLYMIIAIILSAIFGVERVKADKTPMDGMIYYPIGLPKFVVLSVLTLGFYQYYWIYRCWHWLKNEKGENISPFWRTLFMPIMNIALFPKIAKTEPVGPAWFSLAALPLAIAYLGVVTLGSILDNFPNLLIVSGVMSLMSFVLLFPAAKAVLQKNDQNPSAIAENSRISGITGLFALIWLPVSAFIIYLIVWSQ